MDNTIAVKELVFSQVPGESGVKTIAFVDAPAIMVNWVAFSEQKQIKYAIDNEDQRIILSPALIPDLHIPRIDPITQQAFAVVMNRETVFEAAYRWAQEGRQNFANEMHESAQPVDGITWFSSFVSSEHIANPVAFEKLPIGTWFLMGKVNNDDMWTKIKAGQYKGISIEGFFDMIPSEPLTELQMDAILQEILDQL